MARIPRKDQKNADLLGDISFTLTYNGKEHKKIITIMKAQQNQNRPELKVNYNFYHSKHSRRRSDQRGIKGDHINIALNYSESFFKQGLVFHVVKNNLIPDDLDPKMIKKIKNLVIVMAGDEARILTCYRSKNGMKHIKRKSSQLYVNMNESYNNVA